MYGYCDTDTIVHENGHIGHGAIPMAAWWDGTPLSAMNSVIMDGAVIGEESIVAAMSFVKPISCARQGNCWWDHRRAYYAKVTDRELHWKRPIPKNIRICDPLPERGYSVRSR